jgi:hypothetical protein
MMRAEARRASEMRQLMPRDDVLRAQRCRRHVAASSDAHAFAMRMPAILRSAAKDVAARVLNRSPDAAPRDGFERGGVQQQEQIHTPRGVF